MTMCKELAQRNDARGLEKRSKNCGRRSNLTLDQLGTRSESGTAFEGFCSHPAVPDSFYFGLVTTDPGSLSEKMDAWVFLQALAESTPLRVTEN